MGAAEAEVRGLVVVVDECGAEVVEGADDVVGAVVVLLVTIEGCGWHGLGGKRFPFSFPPFDSPCPRVSFDFERGRRLAEGTQRGSQHGLARSYASNPKPSPLPPLRTQGLQEPRSLSEALVLPPLSLPPLRLPPSGLIPPPSPLAEPLAFLEE